MKELLVALSEGRSYDITIEKGILSRCGQEIRKVYNGSQVCVITDSNVAPLYLGKVTASPGKKARIWRLSFPFTTGCCLLCLSP